MRTAFRPPMHAGGLRMPTRLFAAECVLLVALAAAANPAPDRKAVLPGEKRAESINSAPFIDLQRQPAGAAGVALDFTLFGVPRSFVVQETFWGGHYNTSQDLATTEVRFFTSMPI